jgi:hyperosmotically inducible periplasmic protein
MRLTLALSLGLVMLCGCAKDPTTSVAASSRPDLEKTVKDRMATYPTLNSKIKVSADNDKNEVTLSGTVETEQARMQAVDIAKASRAGVTVNDKIDVKPREVSRTEYTKEMAAEAREKAKVVGDKVGESLDDAWIHTKVVAKLIGNSQTPARKINVDVLNNVVTLRGEVESSTAKDEALRVAKETEGVKRVTNLLKVRA